MKAFFHTSEPLSIHSLFRGYGLYSFLDFDIKTIDYTGSISWKDLMDRDIVILQRPSSYSDIQVLNLAKRMNKPVIVEWDFDPLSIREYDKGYEIYSNPQVVKNITELLINCDLLIVGNEKIESKYKLYNENVFTYRSSYPLQFKPYADEETKTNTVVITDIYSSYHDFNKLLPSLKEFIEKNEWYFEIIVTNEKNWSILKTAFESVTNVILHKSAVDTSYLTLLEKLNPALIIYPIVQSEYTDMVTTLAPIYSCFGKCLSTNFNPEFKLSAENLPVYDFKKISLNQIYINKELIRRIKLL